MKTEQTWMSYTTDNRIAVRRPHASRKIVLCVPRSRLKIKYVYTIIYTILYTIKITQKFRQLDIPLLYIFPRAVREPVHNNLCGSFRKKFEHP